MNFQHASALNPSLQSYSIHELGTLILEAEQTALRMQQKFEGNSMREDDLRLIAAEVGIKALLQFDESRGASLKSWVVSKLSYAFMEYNRGSRAQFVKRLAFALDDDSNTYASIVSLDSPYDSFVSENIIKAFGRDFGSTMMAVIQLKQNGLSNPETAQELGVDLREVLRTIRTFQNWFPETY